MSDATPINVTINGNTANLEWWWDWFEGSWSVSIASTEANDTSQIQILALPAVIIDAVEGDDTAAFSLQVTNSVTMDAWEDEDTAEFYAIPGVPLEIVMNLLETDGFEAGDTATWEVNVTDAFLVMISLEYPLYTVVTAWNTVYGSLPSPLPLYAVAAQPTDAQILLPHPLAPIKAVVRLPVPYVGGEVAAGSAELDTRRLLSDPLPLRKVSDIGSYRNDAIIPYVYGTVVLTPIPLDDTNRLWLVADHAVLAITDVLVDGEPITGWAYSTEIDRSDHTITVLRLSRAPEGTLSVEVSGKTDPVTGALLTSPADIVRDIVAMKPGGWTLPFSYLNQLRDDYPKVQLGGVINQETTLRQVLDEILLPLGCLWSMSPFVMMKNQTGDRVLDLDLDAVTSEADHTSLGTVLRVLYAQDYSRNTHGKALMVEAVVERQRYGTIEVTMNAPWIRTLRDALLIAEHWLSTHARPVWKISGKQFLNTNVAVGDTVQVNHPLAPPLLGVVTERTLDRAQAATVYGVQCLAGPKPSMRLVSDTNVIGLKETSSELGILYRDGVATFTVLDDTGAPIYGASVTFDSAITKTTDRLGRVQFTAEPGYHSLLISAAGFEVFELGVTV